MKKKSQFSRERSNRDWKERDLEKGLLYHFKAIVEKHGEKIAVRRGPVTLPYLNLDKQSDRIAFGLLQLLEADGEIGSDTPIGICCSHNENAVVAMVSVLKTGRPYVWLSPSDSEERRAGLLALSGVEIVLLETRYLESLVPTNEIRAVALDELKEQVPAGSVADLPINSNCDFAISFTSGSTSDPKGVRRTQRSLLHQASFLRSVCGLTKEDRIAMIIPATFAACSNDVFVALLTGASLHPFPLAELGTANLASWLRSEAITYCHCVPSVFRSVLAHLGEREGLPDLRWFKLGGEPLFASDIELFRERVGASAKILHSYGATETGGTICADVISNSTELPVGALPVGRPIPGKRVTIVSADGKTLSPGQEGRIVVTSRYLSAGYFSDTAGLGDEPFSKNWKGETRFQSEDLGRFDERGRLSLARRFDGVVKLFGKRIDIDEIENFFRRHELVADCIVTANHKVGRIDVFVVAKGDGPKDEFTRLLKQGFETWEQASQLPISLTVLDCLPTTPNGKIDRNRLQNLELEESILGARIDEFSPRTNLEKQIFEIWSSILGRSDFGIYDDFFTLGGDSLRAINFQARFFEQTGMFVSAAVLFSNFRTIAEIAEEVHHESLKGRGGSAWHDRIATLVKLRTEGNGAPVVFFPGGYGGESELMLFARMVPQLDPNHLIYGLRATSLYRLDERPKSMEELADFYFHLLQGEVGSDPPVLVGNCIAGPVAVEVAKRFRNRGSEPVLILVDSASSRGWFRKSGRRMPEMEKLPDFVRYYYALLEGNAPATYAGDLRLILTDSFRDEETPLLGWDEVVSGGIRLDRVGGDHLSILRAAGNLMGCHLSRVIEEELALRE